MNLRKTEKETLSNDDILNLLSDYEKKEVPLFDELWEYYKGKNTKIVNRKAPDPNNPHYNIPVAYGRKIVVTWEGYGFRPKYITYKAEEQEVVEETETENIEEPVNEFYDALMDTYRLNNEHIKTSRAGRNIGIFGVSYELLYIDRKITVDKELPVIAEPRFFTVDPRNIILLYDFSPEPEKQIGIYFYKINEDLYKVEVYYKDHIELYDRIREEDKEFKGLGPAPRKWVLKNTGEWPNFYAPYIPIVPYYFGDEMMGIIEPVKDLIDAYDLLASDSLVEFDRFAHAYLVLKKVMLTNPTLKKEPGVFSAALKYLKYRRVFELTDKDASVSFLTKDIPFQYIQFMTNLVREEIHVQSHVPDFTSEKMNAVSGEAIKRLLFDFENVVSSVEADFDTALYERMNLINAFYTKKTGRVLGDPNTVVISHKRNMPLNLQEFAQAAMTLKGAGFSSYLVADIMPDDIIPNVDEELARQREEQNAMIPDVYGMGEGQGAEQNVDENGNPIPPENIQNQG